MQGQATSKLNMTLRDLLNLRRSVYMSSLCRREQRKFLKREKISLLIAGCNADGYRESVVEINC